MTRLALALILLADVQAKPAWQERLDKASSSPEAWKARREEIRKRILVAAGLWPEFERPALQPKVFGKVEGDGFTVERVLLETLPGFFLAGSLYRPAGKAGPFPGVLSPHGHWRDGRFTMEKDGHLPARGITFARLGFVCFMYDMIGYADTKQIGHRAPALDEPAWGTGFFGVQTWNSLRAMDFITSLPDVDAKRIGVTGASGGGTQTFILTAIDERVACSAPVNMVAAEFQGGCTCENAPFLRIDLNNVEIAAATAPRPLLLIAATGDWTKHTPTLEGPAIEAAYKALGIAERFRAVQFNAPHNYNQDSRETVYAWFVRWLQGGPDQPRVAEPALPAIQRENLTLFAADFKLPASATDAEGVKKALRERAQAQLADPSKLAAFRDCFRLGFGAQWPSADGFTSTPLAHRDLPRAVAAAVREGKRRATVLAGAPKDLAPEGDLLVLLAGGEPGEEPASGGDASQRKGFPTCFYRTPLAKRVQDVLTAAAWAASRPGIEEVRLVGGAEVVFARALAPAKVTLAIADTGGSDDGESAWGHPHLMRWGGLRTAAALAAPGRLVLHNLQGRLDPSRPLAAYKAAPDALTLSETPWDAARILDALK
jgi:dienelactone hydrolase